MACNNAVTTPEVFIGSEKVHRSTFALRATSGFTIELSHALVHVHADRKSVGMASISRDHVIVIAHEGGRSDGDGLLSDIEVEEAAHRAVLLVVLKCSLLKAPNSNHLAKGFKFLFGRKRFVNRRARKVERGMIWAVGSFHGERFFEGRHSGLCEWPQV